MRKLLLAAAAALSLSLAVPPADARQWVDGGGQRERRLDELDELIAWIDQLLAALDSGSLLLTRPGDIDGGLQAVFVPVDRDELIRMIRLKVALGELTAQEGTNLLLDMSSRTGARRREFRAYRERLVVERSRLRAPLQPWELARPPAGTTAPPTAAACPAATRWRIEVQGSQHGYHFMLVIRADGTADVLLPSGEVMNWVQTRASISGDTLTLDTRDSNGSGSLRATLSPDCAQGQGHSQAYNGNNGPAILTRLN